MENDLIAQEYFSFDVYNTTKATTLTFLKVRAKLIKGSDHEFVELTSFSKRKVRPAESFPVTFGPEVVSKAQKYQYIKIILEDHIGKMHRSKNFDVVKATLIHY